MPGAVARDAWPSLPPGRVCVVGVGRLGELGAYATAARRTPLVKEFHSPCFSNDCYLRTVVARANSHEAPIFPEELILTILFPFSLAFTAQHPLPREFVDRKDTMRLESPNGRLSNDRVAPISLRTTLGTKARLVGP